jgi:hypothetical protein
MKIELSGKPWLKESVNNVLIYTPEGLAEDQVFQFVAHQPEVVIEQSARDWFTFRIAALQSALGKPKKPWKYATEKNGTHSASNQYLGLDGRQYSVGYSAVNVEPDQFLLIQMISKKDFMLMLKYGGYFDNVTQDVLSDVSEGLWGISA